jgi:hypothetical protein
MLGRAEHDACSRERAPEGANRILECHQSNDDALGTHETRIAGAAAIEQAPPLAVVDVPSCDEGPCCRFRVHGHV